MLDILMRCRGYRLSRLKGSLRDTAISEATIESSSIDETAMMLVSFLLETCMDSSYMISLLAYTDPATDPR